MVRTPGYFSLFAPLDWTSEQLARKAMLDQVVSETGEDASPNR